MFSYVICCVSAASTVTVCGSNASVQTTGVHGLRTAPRHTPALAQHKRRTVSSTRRTRWRDNARTSTTRTLCAQHKCRPQGGGQSTTALVADLVVAEIQLRQRRICLVKIARTFHGASWSTSLKHVDNHASPTTPDAKLMELTFHAVSCSSWTLWTRKNNVYSCVTSWHKLSCCVVHGPVECIHTISTHHQRPAEACFAKLRRDIEAIQPHSPDAIACRITSVYLRSKAHRYHRGR